MTLARAVLDRDGTLLFAKDMELTQKVIDRMERLRVRSVLVKGAPVDPLLLPVSDLTSRLSTMEIAFQPTRGNVLMEKLRVMVKAHFIRRDAELKGTEADEV